MKLNPIKTEDGKLTVTFQGETFAIEAGQEKITINGVNFTIDNPAPEESAKEELAEKKPKSRKNNRKN